MTAAAVSLDGNCLLASEFSNQEKYLHCGQEPLQGLS
jgi:hypothetical protein